MFVDVQVIEPQTGLDAGAPGLIEAACECMVEDFLGLGGHVVDQSDRKDVSYEPGPAPIWSS